MNCSPLVPSSLVAALSFAAVPCLAQAPGFLITFSQAEQSRSGSDGTVLGNLLQNEIHYVDFTTTPCADTSAETWMARAAAQAMAGDENGDGLYANPFLFGSIDAVLADASRPAGSNDDQRSVFWSVSAAMGTQISASPFRPGDVARMVRDGTGDGQVEYFMSQEQFALALGLASGAAIDIDAVAFDAAYGVWFSIDEDTMATTACGPQLVRDGDVLCVPAAALTLTIDQRVADVVASSAIVVHAESQMDLFVLTANVADRFGACVTAVGDVDALEFDALGPVVVASPCGAPIPLPTLIFAGERLSGASLLTTRNGGEIYQSSCGAIGTDCAIGATTGERVGLKNPNLNFGPPSHVNGLAEARVCRHVLSPVQQVMSAFPFGAPLGANEIDFFNPFIVSLVLVELVPNDLAASLPAAPFSPLCFPDLYAPTIFPWAVVAPGFGSFPMLEIPAFYTGKVLFQSVGFDVGNFELSTPAIVDVR